MGNDELRDTHLEAITERIADAIERSLVTPSAVAPAKRTHARETPIPTAAPPTLASR